MTRSDTTRRRIRAWCVGCALCAFAAACDEGATVPGAMEAGPTDAGRFTPDAPAPEPARDATTTDTGHPIPDASALDAARDADAQDAGAQDAGVDAGLYLPETLAATGLYRNAGLTRVADGVRDFRPSYALWSDGATKKRWLYLPPGTRIDTSDMDDWHFPVGTKAFKEFTRDGVRVETRMLYKTEAGWFMMAYAWNAAQTEAVAAPGGVVNALGTDHDIPSNDACRECHEGVTDRLLGVSAIQLSHDRAGLDLGELAAGDLLTDPPANDFRLPATAEGDALGYLHANCGNCHNPDSIVFDRADMRLWLPVAALATPAATPTHATTVGVALSETDPGFATRVVAGDPDLSGLVHRMELRGDVKQMPPLASELADTAGTALVRAWIDAL
jgi:hypothetical protein